MTLKNRVLFTVSLAAILSLSLITAMDIPYASADDKGNDKKDDKKFQKKAHFKTADCRLADPAQKENVESQLGITINPDGTLPSEVDCKATALFDKKGKALKYKIEITGMDLVNDDGNIFDDVGKSHFHKAAKFVDGNSENPMGPMHILNIFGQPGMDDADLIVRPIQGIIEGIWDDGDAMDRPGVNDDSFEITDNFIQESLCQGEAFLMVHGQVENEDGSISKPGFIKAALQTTDVGEKFCEKKLKQPTESDL